MLAEAFGPPSYTVIDDDEEYSIVVDNGYPIKNELKKLGFWWKGDDKVWLLRHTYGGVAKQKQNQTSEAKVRSALPKVKTIIHEYGLVVAKSAPAGDAPKVSPQDLAAMHVHTDKAKKVFKKFDIDVYIVPGGAHGQVLFKGKTFDHKHLWKAAGFHWSAADKGWAMPAEKYAPITRKINQQLLKALHKAES